MKSFSGQSQLFHSQSQTLPLPAILIILMWGFAQMIMWRFFWSKLSSVSKDVHHLTCSCYSVPGRLYVSSCARNCVWKYVSCASDFLVLLSISLHHAFLFVGICQKLPMLQVVRVCREGNGNRKRAVRSSWFENGSRVGWQEFLSSLPHPRLVNAHRVDLLQLNLHPSLNKRFSEGSLRGLVVVEVFVGI